MTAAPGPSRPLRPWERLSVRVAVLFLFGTGLAILLTGTWIYRQQKADLEDTLGVQLMNIARTSALLVDPALHAEVQRTRTQTSPAYAEIRQRLARIQDEVLLTTPIYTLSDFDAARRQAQIMVTSRGPGQPGEPYPLVPALIDPLRWTLEDGVARFTPIYRNQSGMWITAIAPVVDAGGKTIAVLDVDYPVEVYLNRLEEIRTKVWQAGALGVLSALLVGAVFAVGVTRPIRALTRGVARVAAGDLSQALPVRSRDEVGQLTRAFNGMLEGLRQRDFIRDTFGRYVSPEVAKTLLESPEGLRLGGEKREVTVLMSDLRGYTRFAEQGDPQRVMEVLNEYLGRMTDIIVEHGGTINEFIGDAVFAVFGAPLAHPDHAERAAASALAMQRAMIEVNRANAARGLPRFEMGIGVNTGEAVVGNIGSAQRAKYAIVGSAVNVAARIEGSTVGGQIFVSAATRERIRDLAEVAPPVPVEVKGLSEPLMLYELRAIGGRFAQRLPEDEGTATRIEVTMPATCWVIEGKTVSKESRRGAVLRLGARDLDVRLDGGPPLASLTNVRLRVGFPGLGVDSGDLYGKVVGEEAWKGERLARIRLTSVDPADQKILEQLLEG